MPRGGAAAKRKPGGAGRGAIKPRATFQAAILCTPCFTGLKTCALRERAFSPVRHACPGRFSARRLPGRRLSSALDVDFKSTIGHCRS